MTKFGGNAWRMAAGIVLCAGGCGVSTAPLVIQVRDADTEAPLAGVYVVADSAKLGPSLKPGDVRDELAGRRNAVTARAVTDGEGTARLEFAPERAVRIGVLRPGRGPVFVLIGAEDTGLSGWVRADEGALNPGDAAEVRIVAPTPSNGSGPGPSRH